MRALLSGVATAALLTLSACGGGDATKPDTHKAELETLPGGIKLVEQVMKTGDEIVIPYSKYVLPNGLTVILHEDDSDPLVHVDVTYHVGSAREEIGKSGFAHFFEHMQFQGSENVADEEHFGLITASGGTLNGSTNTDRTNYYETVPSNQLEKMLWLEADRMGFFLDAVTQEKFENQRETVKNERGQNYDNRPYGLLRERVNEAMFPEGHPYSWLTIGYIEDLNRANLDDLKNFFLRWYGPNNATLTIGGRLDKRETLEWVHKYFGSIPAGPDVAKPDKPLVTLAEDRYISMEDNVTLPLIYMSWPTVYARHADEAPLDVLMEIMGTGRTSLLYKNLVKDSKAVQASAGHGCGELSCQFTLLALPNPASGTSMADLETIMRASLDEFETRGVQDDDLTRVKAGIVSGMIYGLESVSGKVSQLAAYETYTDNPNYIKDDIARYENVTKADVMRVYEQYIKGKPAVVMSIVPNGEPDAIARPDTWTRTPRTIPDSPERAEVKLRPATDDFDRSVQPGAGDNPSITLPAMWNGELGNGIKVLGAVNDETPTVAISLRIEAGQRRESLDKIGLANLTANMMNESTTESSVEDLSNRLDKLGSSVRIFAGERYATVSIRSLTENVDETLAIAAEKLFKPAFTEEDFARVKDQVLENIKQRPTDASRMADMAYDLLLYGDDNAAAFPDEGIEDTVSAITLEDVKAFYDAYYTPGAASIVSVSNLSEKATLEKLAVFAGMEGKSAPSTMAYSAPALDPTKLYFIDKPDAAQSEIRIGRRGLPYDAMGTYYRSFIANYPLGGAFNSRINLNLREDKGYTYGARSFFFGNDLGGEYTARAGVRADSTTDSIRQFLNEIDAYQDSGITADELTFTKSAIGQSDARRYETPRQKLGFIGRILDYDLPDGFVAAQNKILAEMSAEDVNAIAAELETDDMIIVVVGDKSVVMDDLKTLGREIVVLGADGKPL